MLQVVAFVLVLELLMSTHVVFEFYIDWAFLHEDVQILLLGDCA